MSDAGVRQRREPPAFRPVAVVRTERVSDLMVRVVVAGDALEGFSIPAPAASVRILIPDSDELVIPEWQGNDFRYADGGRPLIRTLTPRRFDADRRELDLDIVLHDGGAMSQWAGAVESGEGAAISGPGRGYEADPDADRFVLMGDETAIPAICQLLEHIGPMPIVVHVDVRSSDAVVDLHRDVDAHWHIYDAIDAMGSSTIDALEALDLTATDRVWAAGEAGAMRRLRTYLFEQRGFDRSSASIRGYWKQR